MAIMDPNAEQDVMKLWQLVVDLSEQLTQTKQVVSSLYAESQKLKVGDRLAPPYPYLDPTTLEFGETLPIGDPVPPLDLERE